MEYYNYWQFAREGEECSPMGHYCILKDIVKLVFLNMWRGQAYEGIGWRLLQDGLQRNITMLERLNTEIQTIQRGVEGLVQMGIYRLF